MINFLLVTGNPDAYSEFVEELLKETKASLVRSKSGNDAFSMISKQFFDLVIVDELLIDMSGLLFAEKLAKQNPFIHCTVVSSLDEEAFHEASEGLGLLPSLPPQPGRMDARNLLDQLFKIKGLITDEKR